MSYECDFCYSTFNTPRACTQHENAVHPWRCDHCNSAYRNRADLNDHVDEEHTVWHDCKICPNYGQSSRFKTEHSLDQHVQAAIGHQNYCYGCKRTFTSPNALSQHLKSSIHVGKNVKCPWCPNMYVNLTGVAHHLESNSCSSGITRDQIEKFVRSVDRDHVITKKLLTYDGYGENQDIYATEDSWNGNYYECYFCNRQFTSLMGLNAYLRSPAHEQKRYHCPRCRTEFARLSGLVNHIESEKCGVLRFNLTGGGIQGMVRHMITY